ncbi:MAG TPA: polysaccharide deacetylase family protein [Bryobacteraceae bacterium]|nr:polysaccharide deacetylase family protein [Bryobacteraceae bacterium]
MKRSIAVFATYFAFALGSTPPVKLASTVTVLAVSEKFSSEVTAVESDLEMLGVPYETTRNFADIAQAPMVILAGTLTNVALAPADREMLYRYVELGGLLVATHVQGDQYFPLFGLAGFAVSQKNAGLHFEDPSADAALRYINRPEERDIVLGDPKRYKEFNWTTEYEPARATVLGKFANGKAAFVRSYYGRGTAYSLGLSFSDSTLRLAIGQSFEAEPEWANVFAPSGDVLRLVLRAIYESNVHPFLLVHTVPDGLDSALLLSHDIDARESYPNAVVFAALEQHYGVTSTFFATTKYFTDETDIGYYTPVNAAYLREVRARGFDVGSHTVSHLKTFNKFPVGDPAVRFATYRPTAAPTVFGEIQVSKELLDRDVPGQHTITFRAGELAHPPRLIEALETAGYLVDSTRAAGNTLTNCAYRPLREAHLGSPVSSMIEIPVTLDDSMGYLTPTTVDKAVAQWTNIVAANAENNNITCLLVHPTDITYKLTAEERLLQAYRHKPIWIGSVTKYGLFARARAAVRATPFAYDDHIEIRLNQPSAKLPQGLTLAMESGPRWNAVSVRDSDGLEIPFTALSHADRRMLILKP